MEKDNGKRRRYAEVGGAPPAAAVSGRREAGGFGGLEVCAGPEHFARVAGPELWERAVRIARRGLPDPELPGMTWNAWRRALDERGRVAARVAGRELSPEQAAGCACVVCGRDDRPQVPVAGVESEKSTHLFRCAVEECAAALERGAE